MQLLLVFDHREEGAQLIRVVAVLGVQLADLPVGVHRERGRDERQQDAVRGAEHVLGQQADFGRAVEHDVAIVAAQSRQAVAQAGGRPSGAGEGFGQPAVRERPGQQVETVEIGRLDVVPQRFAAAQKQPVLGLEFGPDAKVERGRGLRIEVAHERRRPRLRRQIGEIDRRGRFADPAFQVIDRQHLHRPDPSGAVGAVYARCLGRAGTRGRSGIWNLADPAFDGSSVHAIKEGGSIQDDPSPVSTPFDKLRDRAQRAGP